MLRFVAKGGISALLIWLVFRNQDVGALLHQMLTVERWALGLAVALLGALILSLALRWSAILGAMGHPMGPRITFPLVLIGLFFNQVLPSSVGGDAVRMWLVYKSGLPGIAAISSVVLDRMLGILALLVLITAGLPELFALSQNPVTTYSVLLLLCSGYFGFVAIMVLDRVPEYLKRYRIVRVLAQLAADFRKILLSARAAPPVLAYSLINQVGSALVVFVLAQGLGLQASLPAYLLIVPLANLVQALPISIAGWGVREGFFIVAFGMVGVGAPQALALSVLYGLLNMFISLPGGVVWLARGREKPMPQSLIAGGE